MFEFDRREIERLLGLLDGRLRARGIAASVYVVGGAAIAMGVLDSRRTLDIDAIVSDPAVLVEAQSLSASEGIAPTWLNESAKPWVPPRPPDAMPRSQQPGLAVYRASDDHLLAMKLVAMRSRDALDIVVLAKRVGLGEEPSGYADLLERVYAGEGVLEQVLGVAGEDVRTEAMRRGEIAAALFRRAGG